MSPIVLQVEARPLAQALALGGARIGDAMLLLRQRDAGDIGAADFGQVKAEPAPTAADIENSQACGEFVR